MRPLREVDLRLVDEAEFVVVDRAAQVRFQLQALLLLQRERRAERLPAVADAALAVVHRHVGVLDQHQRAVAMVRRAGDADARGDGEFLATHAEAVAEYIEDLGSQPLRPRLVIGSDAHHQEFVAAEARDQALGADRALDALRGTGDDGITGAMAEHIVDHLEAVEVDVQHGDAGLRAILQPRIQFEQHRIAVEQAGERIGSRQHAQGFLGLLAFGDVLQRAGHARADRVAGFGFADDAHPHRMAVGIGALQFEFELLAVLQGALQRVVETVAFEFAQGGLHLRHRHRLVRQAERALRFHGEMDQVASGIPLPAADVGQVLHPVEQRAVAHERR